MSLGKFFVAVWDDWVSLMSGAASLVLSFWGGFVAVGPEWVQRSLIGAGIVCFILSAYRVWSTEHKKVEELEKLHFPDLHGKLQLVYINSVPLQEGLEEVETLLTCIVEIKNLGAPSVATGWKLYVTLPGIPETVWIPCKLGDGALTIPIPKDGRSFKYSPDDALLSKALKPIKTGARMEGFLHFLTPFPRHQLVDSRTRIELAFCDVRDKVVTAKGFITPIDNPQPYFFGGMKTKLKAPKTQPAQVEPRFFLPLLDVEKKRWLIRTLKAYLNQMVDLESTRGEPGRDNEPEARLHVESNLFIRKELGKDVAEQISRLYRARRNETSLDRHPITELIRELDAD